MHDFSENIITAKRGGGLALQFLWPRKELTYRGFLARFYRTEKPRSVLVAVQVWGNAYACIRTRIIRPCLALVSAERPRTLFEALH